MGSLEVLGCVVGSGPGRFGVLLGYLVGLLILCFAYVCAIRIGSKVASTIDFK